MRHIYHENTLQNEIRSDRQDRRDRIENDLNRYGGEVLESDELKAAYDQTHHLWSTVGEHTLRVAMSSVMMCYALRKLRVPVNIPAVVVGSLCHDLGILDRDTKYADKRECSHEHPIDSVKVARELIPDLPEESADIIERHMWPAGGSKIPNSLEGIIVSIADKYVAAKDLIKGSDIMNTGVRNVAREKRSKLHESASEKWQSLVKSEEVSEEEHYEQ